MIRSLLFIAFVINSDCRELYLNKVLASRNNGQYYLVVKIHINGEDREVVVLNYNLYKYLKAYNNKFSDSAYYTNEIRKKINERKSIVFTNAALRNTESVYIKNDSAAAETAKKGKQSFIDHFFIVSHSGTYARLKPGVKEHQLSQIIKILFEWNYLVGMVEGTPTIIDVKLCE